MPSSSPTAAHPTDVYRVAAFACATRAVVLAAAAASAAVGVPYDSSAPLAAATTHPASRRPLDAPIIAALKGLSHWDAVYFLRIAESRGYDCELYHAFFPLMPAATVAFRRVPRWRGGGWS